MNLKLSWRTVYSADPFYNEYEWQYEAGQNEDDGTFPKLQDVDSEPHGSHEGAASSTLWSRFKSFVKGKKKPGKWERLMEEEPEPKPPKKWKDLFNNTGRKSRRGGWKRLIEDTE